MRTTRNARIHPVSSRFGPPPGTHASPNENRPHSLTRKQTLPLQTATAREEPAASLPRPPARPVASDESTLPLILSLL
eukprot:699509-Prorocentrum_minimum.AAC.2